MTKLADKDGDWRDGDDPLLPDNCKSLLSAVIESARKAALRRDLDAIAFFTSGKFRHWCEIMDIDVTGVQRQLIADMSQQSWWDKIPLPENTLLI